MKQVVRWLPLLLVCCFLCSCRGQEKPTKKDENVNSNLGGPCEGCEAVYEYGTKELNALDTIIGFKINEPKLLLQGTVFQLDGTTPAEGVIIYAYHTNRDGLYPPSENSTTTWARRHGKHREWVKTGKDGHYAFYTFRPAAYPTHSDPEHIHLTIKEPGKKAYYIDEVIFEDDTLITPTYISKLEDRGGSGLVKPFFQNGMLTATRDIILGKNIPHYN
ncbi:MAG: intradiol ring-cleavage dioxygenase [Croceitalea sp.]|nr:intradiol ring-cleavage dioxygenase [Croceitalea sp.]NNL08993.1 intradiol ring-cleavage dioxygenase [Croceitalea sp.]NNM18952.1 intradiol ring-cleavage dioxygenase [Croceitalea sp.]